MKASLLANAELQQDAALAGEIDRLDTKHSLSGATLRDIAGRFKFDELHFRAMLAALAIRCLYSRGVSDYATLSVANRLTDQDAFDLEVGDKRNDFFGNALVQEPITVDLTPDVPVVTDIRLSQELR